MRVSWRHSLGTLALLFITIGHVPGASAEPGPAESIPAADLVQPADLAAEMRQSAQTQPLILQVGFRVLFEEAHIAAAVYAGPGNSGAGLKSLRAHLAAVPKHQSIVIYCGCCPWSHCPNVAAAYDELHRLGFDRVRVLYIAENFGHDWIDPGYPIAKGT
jgi:hypothetical protein